MDLATFLPLVGRLTAAMALGGLIGYQRERKRRPAGLRTHMLVALGSGLITLVSESYSIDGGDPARISAQIVSGIGFLGAGTIIRHGSTVSGLTTAASLWTVAGIGIAAARGGTILALSVYATLLALITLTIVDYVEDHIVRTSPRRHMRIIARPEAVASVLEALAKSRVAIIEFIAAGTDTGGSRPFRLNLEPPQALSADVLVEQIAAMEGVHSARWEEGGVSEGMMATFHEHIQEGVDRVLDEVLRARSLPVALDGMIRYHLGWVDGDWTECPRARRAAYGGKKMRAVLCALASGAAGGSLEAAFPVAAAIEMVQNFSLVHDDIEDGDRERRHRPTVWVNWGVPQAINTGSAMQALVNAAVLRAEAPAETVLDIMDALTWAMVEMTEGQHLDIAFQTRADVSVPEYEDMASRKTGALMEAAVYTGARLATVDAGRLAAWREFGRAFGLAFQVRDDLLGVWGEPDRTGKPVGNDIRARKKTLPLLYAFSLAGPDDLGALNRTLGREEVDDEGVRIVTEIMERSGARDATVRTEAAQSGKALSALDRAAEPGLEYERLRSLVQDAVGREV